MERRRASAEVVVMLERGAVVARRARKADSLVCGRSMIVFVCVYLYGVSFG